MELHVNHPSLVVNFKRLRASGETEIRLARDQIHALITEVSDIVVAKGPADTVSLQSVTVRRRLANNDAFTSATVEVSNPSTASHWIGELRRNAAIPPAQPRYYQFANWIIELMPGNGYYMEVYGSINADVAFGRWDAGEGRWSIGSTYVRMKSDGGFESEAAGSKIRAWLQGKRTGPAREGTANIALAMFVSESTRNYRTWLINLMALDLIEAGKLDWDHFIEWHPMARGGTYTRGVTGMQGGAKDSRTKETEINIAMQWLQARQLPRSSMWIDTRNGGHGAPDDVNAACANVKALLLQRARTVNKM